MPWYTPLSLIKSGIDFQTSANRSEKQVCWWNCWHINCIDARAITPVPRLLTLKHFSLFHEKEWELEFSRQYLLISTRSLIRVLFAAYLSLSRGTWVRYWEMGYSPQKFHTNAASTLRLQSRKKMRKARTKILTINFLTSSLWYALQGLFLRREHQYPAMCRAVQQIFIFEISTEAWKA